MLVLHCRTDEPRPTGHDAMFSTRRFPGAPESRVSGSTRALTRTLTYPQAHGVSNKSVLRAATGYIRSLRFLPAAHQQVVRRVVDAVRVRPDQPAQVSECGRPLAEGGIGSARPNGRARPPLPFVGAAAPLAVGAVATRLRRRRDARGGARVGGGSGGYAGEAAAARIPDAYLNVGSRIESVARAATRLGPPAA